MDLTGKTVMPAIIDAHKHLAVTRDALVDQLQHFAYYGIGATMSTTEVASLRCFPDNQQWSQIKITRLRRWTEFITRNLGRRLIRL